MRKGLWRRVAWGVAIVVIALLVRTATKGKPFPSDHTAEGAYLRIVKGVTENRLEDAFAYLETDAQWACYSIMDLRRKAVLQVTQSYPPSEAKGLLDAYGEEARAGDGSKVFALFAARRGYGARLRRDMSGVVRTEVEGDRASVVTARGTRYPFRRRENGIWGLTLFTAELVAESERAARDLGVVSRAAADYDRAKP